MYVVGFPLRKERDEEREREREKGREGRREGGNYKGCVYTYGIYVCTGIAVGLEGNPRNRPPGWSNLVFFCIAHFPVCAVHVYNREELAFC